MLLRVLSTKCMSIWTEEWQLMGLCGTSRSKLLLYKKQ